MQNQHVKTKMFCDLDVNNLALKINTTVRPWKISYLQIFLTFYNIPINDIKPYVNMKWIVCFSCEFISDKSILVHIWRPLCHKEQPITWNNGDLDC